LNHRKKTKANGSRLIPRKHTETLVLLSVNKTLFTEVNQRKRFMSWEQDKYCILRGLLLQQQPGHQDNTFTWN